MAAGKQVLDECRSEVPGRASDRDRWWRPCHTGFPRVEASAMRYALAMALKVMVEAGIVGKFDASVRNTLEKPLGRPNRSLSKLLRGRKVMGKLPPK